MSATRASRKKSTRSRDRSQPSEGQDAAATVADDAGSLFDDVGAGQGNGAGEGGGGSGGGGGYGENGDPGRAPLHELARRRYLNYALSVITSRALPDVRDGLKPVQRRILYTMWTQRLTAEAKPRKCANVVGAVMGNYHPHGDSAIYEALVRMAQPFSMRAPLVDGSGNFGSLDGDPLAAMRYTECRLAAVSSELLAELSQQTVPLRPNYDGTRNEPVVLPTRLPNLLINGATGIAVGMATNIPPHNPGEVCNALLKLLDNAELKTHHLLGKSGIQGPDFPTGGQVLNTQDELREIYKNGSGSIRIRCTTQPGEKKRSVKYLYITSVPYTVNKSTLVEQIAQVVTSRKLPLLLDVRDLSTDDVRIQLELKRDVDEKMVLAYLYKHTSMQTTFAVNLTCLLPTENPEVSRPQRCDLREILQHFLNFRLEVVTRRLEHELGQLKKRIHILEGFALIFDALDEILRIIRASDGKADAAKKIMAKFKQLDEEQTDAILELRLYRLARLEIKLIQDELKQKRSRVDEIEKLLADEAGRWKLVRDELVAIGKQYGGKGDPRRTIIEAPADEPSYSAEDFIVAEDNHVLITRDGLVKRQKEIRDPAATRVREGDRVLACEIGSTRSTIAFFSNFGTAYTSRIIDIPATTGYGEPIQKLFKLKDGERIVAAFSLDPRVSPGIEEDPAHPDYAPQTHGLAVTSDGYALRFGLGTFAEPSTRNGRRYARPARGAEVVGTLRIDGTETILAVSTGARALACAAEEVNYLSNPGRGVMLMKLAKGDRILGIRAASSDRDTLTVRTSMGGEQRINTARYEVTSRGGKGREVIKRGKIVEVVPETPAAPVLTGDD